MTETKTELLPDYDEKLHQLVMCHCCGFMSMDECRNLEIAVLKMYTHPIEQPIPSIAQAKNEAVSVPDLGAIRNIALDVRDHESANDVEFCRAMAGEIIALLDAIGNTPQVSAQTMGDAEPQKIDQTRTGEKGNCFSACLAMMIGIDISEVPNFFDAGGTDADWWEAARVWLAGYNLGCVTMSSWDHHVYKTRGFLLVGGDTSRGLPHSVIFKDGKLWHDPHSSHEGLSKIDSIDILYPLNPLLPIGKTALSAQTGNTSPNPAGEASRRALDHFSLLIKRALACGFVGSAELNDYKEDVETLRTAFASSQSVSDDGCPDDHVQTWLHEPKEDRIAQCFRMLRAHGRLPYEDQPARMPSDEENRKGYQATQPTHRMPLPNPPKTP